MGQDKNWASNYIFGPLNEPEPSAVDGPGNHFRPEEPVSSNPPPYKAEGNVRVQNTGSSTSTNPFRRSSAPQKTGASANSNETSHPSNGYRSSRTSTTLPGDPFTPTQESPKRSSLDHAKPEIAGASTRPRRSSSLRQRYPGDNSIYPLDQLKHENKLAQRSPHLRKQHQPRPDQIDHLDRSTVGYHHEGPYDAALLVRNTSHKNSPVAALGQTNEEALKATPHEKIKDSLHQHRPLDGTALVPPGHSDTFGQQYDYEEGTDMMRDLGGDYRRWPGVTYLPDDLKGKGEPSYSLDKALKDHDRVGRLHKANGQTFELAERPRAASDSQKSLRNGHQSYARWEEQTRRGQSLGHTHTKSDGLKRRVGSLRKKET